jgi:hypothetical protein
VRIRLDGIYVILFLGKPLLVKELTKTEKDLESLSVA